MHEMEQIQRCDTAMNLLNEQQQQHLRMIREICQLTGVIYEPTHDIFEEYHVGQFPFQDLRDVLNEKHRIAQSSEERRRIEVYRDYLRNLRLAAEIAILDDEDQAMLREAIKLNLTDLEQMIPSIRIRQAWKDHEASERITMENEQGN